jgi:hypothetical protein
MSTKFVVFLISIGLFLGGPALASPLGSVPTSESSSSQVSQLAPSVFVTQGGRGSFFGSLEWTAVADASSYMIYKTGSIRPSWRKFRSVGPSITKTTIVDKPGSIAIYKVVAIVGGSEVLIGTFKYFPSR